MSIRTDQQHDAERLAQWASDHGPAVRGFLFGIVRRHDLADDLTQDVFRRAWQARLAYQENGTPRAYLLRIADRLACDAARKNKGEVTLDDDAWQRCEPAAEDLEPSQFLFEAEQTEQLNAALDRLSMTQRRVLLLRFFGNLEFVQIAEAMNCPLNTALSHCHRGLQALRRLLIEKI